MDRDCGLICKSPQFSEKETANPPFRGSKRPRETRPRPQFLARTNTPEQAQRSAEAAFSVLSARERKTGERQFDTDSMVEGLGIERRSEEGSQASGAGWLGGPRRTVRGGIEVALGAV